MPAAKHKRRSNTVSNKTPKMLSKTAKLGALSTRTPFSLVKIEEETEVRYLVQKSEIASLVSAENLRPVLIRQSYICGKSQKVVLRRLFKIAPQLKRLLGTVVKTMRLRQIYSPQSKRNAFFAQIKGPRKGILSRTEISVSLTRPQFFDLLPLASGGYVEKLRFMTHASLPFRGKDLKAEVHIDIIRQLGNTNHRLQGKSLPSLLRRHGLVEVEIPHRAAYASLLKHGSELIPILGNALNLTALRKEGGLKFSLRVLAEGAKHRQALSRQMERIQEVLPSFIR